MDSPINSNKESLVIGISRSGRVRKKSSKLLDFQSPDELEKKSKRKSFKDGRHIEDDDDFNEEWDADEQFEDATSESLHDAADSDVEMDELVAGVAAECMTNNDSKVRQSLYMTEKSNMRKMLKDGKVVTEKLERKDKGCTRFTAYSMWAREFRNTSKFSKNQDLDFSNASRRLSELWANVSNKEKIAWRRKAKIQASKARVRKRAEANSSNSFTNRATTSRTKKIAAEQEKSPPSGRTNNKITISGQKRRSELQQQKNNPSPSKTVGNSNSSSSSQVDSRAVHKNQMPSIDVIEAAAHLKLLGESLNIIGDRLKEHEGQIAISGSLSVLLDSLLCSLGPLMCLTTNIPGIEKKTQLKENLVAILDNIAYVIPGL